MQSNEVAQALKKLIADGTRKAQSVGEVLRVTVAPQVAARLRHEAVLRAAGLLPAETPAVPTPTKLEPRGALRVSLAPSYRAELGLPVTDAELHREAVERARKVRERAGLIKTQEGGGP